MIIYTGDKNMYSEKLNKIIDEINPKIKINESDYIKNGLLFCGRCHTQKQTIVTINNEKKIVNNLCECELQALKERQRKEEKEYSVKKIKKECYFNSALLLNTFDKDDNLNENASRIARNYVKNFDLMKKNNKGLLFFGDVGTGKTFLASCICNALLEKNISVKFSNFAEIEKKIFKDKDYYTALNKFDLLVIDDLNTERNNEYMNEIIMNTINYRYQSKKPLIITTNLTDREMVKPNDLFRKRIFSRIFEICYPVKMTGKDRRKENMSKEYDYFKNILENE